MTYRNYIAPAHIRVYRDICWYTRYLFHHMPDIIAGLGIAVLVILLPIMAAFVV